MQLRSAFKVLGVLLLLLSLSMSLVLLWSLYELAVSGSPDLSVFYALGTAILLGFVAGGSLLVAGAGYQVVPGRREAFLIVSLAWFTGAGIGALPFYLWALYSGHGFHVFSDFVNCYFEAMSGLTTTGSSVLANISELPRGLLLWRAMIQWLGGLGIVVLFVAVMPMIAMDNKKIFQAETSSIGSNQDTPSLQNMAQTLWIIYAALTGCQILLMKFADPDLDWFTCITFGFSTAATAGFSVLNESAGSISVSAQWVVVLFMFLAGVNYALFYQLIKGRIASVLKNTELRAYGGTILIAIFVIALVLNKASYPSMTGEMIERPSLARAGLDAAFQVVSVHTTTGFSNVNSDAWPDIARYVLILLMFVGGCSGSTGGGIKVIRFVALFRMLAAETERAFRPNVVRPCMVGGSPLSAQQQHSIMVHILFVCALTLFSALILLLLEGSKTDLLTSFTAVLASVNNIGPGFSLVGAAQNYAWFSVPSKCLLIFLMAVGRLEVFTVFALLSRKFWRL